MIEGLILIVALLAAAIGLAVLRSIRGMSDRIDELQAAIDAQRDVDVRPDLARINAQVDRLAAAAGLPELDAPPPRVSRVPQVLRTRPVVKAMAFGTGTAHAARRLRNGNGNGNGNGKGH